MKTDLHCGACMESFEEMQDLKEHLKGCVAAKILLPAIHRVHFLGEVDVGHPLGSLIYLIHKNVHLIKRYAYAVADDMNSIERAKIHHELCDKLYLDYKEFKPFEDSSIKTLPNRVDSEKILWKAIGEELDKR